MNKVVKWSAWIGGGVVFFGAAYAGFAMALGAKAKELVPGHASEKEATASAETTNESHEPVEAPHVDSTRAPVRTSSASLLDVFQIQAPYSSTELEELASELKLKNKEFDRRLAELDEREHRADLRGELLDQRQADLQKIRTELEQRELELEQRSAEVERDEAAKAQRDSVGWTKLAKLFNEGDATELGKKLAGYPPEDAAKILDQLKPARAKELLDSLPPDKWREYAEAYRTLTAPKHD